MHLIATIPHHNQPHTTIEQLTVKSAQNKSTRRPKGTFSSPLLLMDTDRAKQRSSSRPSATTGAAPGPEFPVPCAGARA